MSRLRTGHLWLLAGVLCSVALSTAGALDSLARDVGVAAVLSPGHPYAFAVGETIVPGALIRNYGTEPARNFDVRCRINPDYEYTIVVPALDPGTGLEVRFQPWVATTPGQYVVACTTRLDGDENAANNRRLVSVRVLRPPVVFIERDQADSIEVGATRSYRFHADMRGEAGDSVQLLPVAVPPGWRARYYDSTGTTPLPGSDRFGLGFIAPDTRCAFTLAVSAPPTLADTSLPTIHLLAIRGATVGDTAALDSALLTLALVPGLEVHNYPNPFGTSTRFIIGIPTDAVVSLAIYDRVGTLIRRLIDRESHPGPVVLRPTWDGTNGQGRLVAPGTYQYLLEVTRGGRTERIQKRLVMTRDRQQ